MCVKQVKIASVSLFIFQMFFVYFFGLPFHEVSELSKRLVWKLAHHQLRSLFFLSHLDWNPHVVRCPFPPHSIHCQNFQFSVLLTFRTGFLPGKLSFLDSCFISRNGRWLLVNVALWSQLSLSSEVLLLQNVSNAF